MCVFFKTLVVLGSQVGQDIIEEIIKLKKWLCSINGNSNGSIVAVGAPEDNYNGTNSGYVRIYELFSGSWSPKSPYIYGESSQDKSALSVSLSGDGNTVAIGAPFNDGNGPNSGHVRIYQNRWHLLEPNWSRYRW